MLPVGTGDAVAVVLADLSAGASEAGRVLASNPQPVAGRLLVSLAQLIELYGYSESWWRARVAEGLPSRKWGSRLRFDPSEVERWLDERYAD